MRARAMRARAMRYELVAAYPTHRPPPAKKNYTTKTTFCGAALQFIEATREDLHARDYDNGFTRKGLNFIHKISFCWGVALSCRDDEVYVLGTVGCYSLARWLEIKIIAPNRWRRCCLTEG